MKSPLRQYRLKSESTSNKNNQSKRITRRLSTQPDSNFLNPEDSSVFRKASLNKSLFQTSSKAGGNYLTVLSKCGYETPSPCSSSKHNFQLLSNMSKKSYDKVLAYGWSHLKSKQDNNPSIFNINLGKVKLFTIMETSNGKHICKALSEKFTIKIMKIMQETEFNELKQSQINEAFMELKNEADQERYEFSIISMAVDEDKIIISSFGGLGALCFTKKQQLINLAEMEIQPGSSILNNSFNAVKSTRYTSSYRTANKFYSSIKAPPLSQHMTHRTYNCSDIVWISLYSSKILQKCNKKYLKDCINKQFMLTSKTYTLGEAAMQSCKKIINDMMRDECYSSMTALVVLFDQYPFQEQLKISIVKTPQTIWGKMKNCAQDTKAPQNKTQNGPKLLKYIGNRRSFVKNATTDLSKESKK